MVVERAICCFIEWAIQMLFCLTSSSNSLCRYPTSGRNSYTCSQAVNPDASVLVIGGCKYEMPLGACKDSGKYQRAVKLRIIIELGYSPPLRFLGADPTAGTKGCASNLEASMNRSLGIQGGVVFLFTFFQVGPSLSRRIDCNVKIIYLFSVCVTTAGSFGGVVLLSVLEG